MFKIDPKAIRTYLRRQNCPFVETRDNDNKTDIIRVMSRHTNMAIDFVFEDQPRLRIRSLRWNAVEDYLVLPRYTSNQELAEIILASKRAALEIKTNLETFGLSGKKEKYYA